MAEDIIIRNTQSPGDYVVLTAALRDIDTQYPGRFHFIQDTFQPDVFRYNPHVEIGHLRGRRVIAQYSHNLNPYGIKRSNQNRTHFLWGFLGDLNIALGTKAVLGAFRPDLYISEEEKATPILSLDKPYWVFVSGGKQDFTAKIWASDRWQEVVNRLCKDVVMVQVGGGSHIHPSIKNVYDLTGRTSFRELMRLIYHSHGVMCIVTCLMHIAAGYNKPCIVIAGGREPYTWEAYTEETRLINMRIGIPNWNPPPNDPFIPHRFLHTIGQLSCCHSHGCWKSRVVGGDPCRDVATLGNIKLPRCLYMITPDMVIENWKWYYESGIVQLGAPHRVIVPEALNRLPEEPVFKPLIRPEPVEDVRPIVFPGTHVFVYSGGTPGEYIDRIKQFFNDSPVTISGKESRIEFMRDMPNRAQRELIAYFEYPILPVEGFKSWAAFTPLAVGGILCWRSISEHQSVSIQSAAWFKHEKFKETKYTQKPYVVYPRKGFLLATTGALKAINWTNLTCGSEDDLEVLVGASVEQNGVGAIDVGHMVEEMI